MYIQEIAYFDPITVVEKLSIEDNFIFFDSATRRGEVDRYSFIAYDPFSLISCESGMLMIDGRPVRESPLITLSNLLTRYASEQPVPLAPFTGGLAGYIGYEFTRYIDPKITLINTDDRHLPDLLLGLFDLVIVFDHISSRCWIYSSGLPEENMRLKETRAKQRCHQLMQLIEKLLLISMSESEVFLEAAQIKAFLTYEMYEEKIKKALKFIEAGDIYQVNIAQKFGCLLPEDLSPTQLYARLRRKNPAPFSSYFCLNKVIIASASPERFLTVQNNVVTASPIKGTIQRSTAPLEDRKRALKLSVCSKNRAENLMIVDLWRNDLSKVCELFTVTVPSLFSLETYASVHHLVSTIQGKLKPDYTLIDLLAATFPGGSITGAPKKRAIEIIDELEEGPRGPYCGCLTYLGFDRRMDSSILIRTYVIKDTFLTFHVGGGIIADSVPREEYIETLVKANLLYATLTGEEIPQLT